MSHGTQQIIVALVGVAVAAWVVLSIVRTFFGTLILTRLLNTGRVSLAMRLKRLLTQDLRD